MFAPVCTAPGLHGLPVRRAPMVEQAVQTVPLVGAGQKKGNAVIRPQSKQPVCPAQRSRWEGSQFQKENIPTSKQLGRGSINCCLFPFGHQIQLKSNGNLCLDRAPPQTTAAKTQGQVASNQKQKPKQGKVHAKEVKLDSGSERHFVSLTCYFLCLACFLLLNAASRRSRNRVRGQLLVKNSKSTTLKFDSDFDFETANAQFNDDITKEDVGVS